MCTLQWVPQNVDVEIGFVGSTVGLTVMPLAVATLTNTVEGLQLYIR